MTPGDRGPRKQIRESALPGSVFFGLLNTNLVWLRGILGRHDVGIHGEKPHPPLHLDAGLNHIATLGRDTTIRIGQFEFHRWIARIGNTAFGHDYRRSIRARDIE